MKPLRVLLLIAAAALLHPQVSAGAQGTSALTFCCSRTNDLFRALGSKYPRQETTQGAIREAAPGSGVLILAEGYPLATTRLSPDSFAEARAKGLRLFLEYPDAVPGLQVSAPRQTTWERIIVASDMFAPALPRLRILAAPDCHFTSVTGLPGYDLAVARVAGYDTAVFGLPQNDVFPILFKVTDQELIVATTKLSSFVSARYAPSADWEILWKKILSTLAPQENFQLQLEPVVTPAFSATAPLPRHFERFAFEAAAKWFGNSHLLVHPSEQPALYQALLSGAETIGVPQPNAPEGDGSLGVLEGYASGIQFNGHQLRRLPLRADCNTESAMVFALDALLSKNARSRCTAANLLQFVYSKSGMCAGARANPLHPAYGLIGWGDVAPAWLVANYGDDNARSMLATAVASAALKSNCWDRVLMRALLANFRTTGKLGFRGDRIDVPTLEQNGWQLYYNAAPVNYSPHFESYLWACYLWAYHQTGFRPFLDRTTNAIAMTMKVYPEGWRWQDNLERARMLLCLAWLVRLEDTAEHRLWLNRVANDLLAFQQPSGALRERLGTAPSGHFRVPARNEDYGTGETPLLQQNGDPVSDQLYTTGFALLGLHEAAGATGDKRLKAAEDKLAEFLCRIQTRSAKLRYLNGTWFRAFDDRRWEAWASSADVGWGAWSIESGWGQAWTAAVLALRESKTTVWELTGRSGVRSHFAELKEQLAIPEP